MRLPGDGPWMLVLSVAAVWGTGCDPGGWRLVESGTEKDLRSVFVEAADRVYISGDDGTVLLWDGEVVTDTSTDAGGAVFVPDLYGIVASGDEVTTAGDDGAVFTRRMAKWTRDQSNTGRRMLAMIRPTPSLFYAVGEGGRVIRRNTGTDTWEQVDAGAPRDAKVTGGWGQSRDTIVLSTDRGVVLELIDGSWVSQTVETETSTTPAPLFAVWSSTRGADLVTVGLGGAIFRRPEGEVTFTREETRVTQDLYAVFGSSRDRAYAVGARGSILGWDGVSWSIEAKSTSSELFAVHGLDDGSLFVAVGSRGTIAVLRQ